MSIIKLGNCKGCGKRFFCDFDRTNWDGMPIDDQCNKCEEKHKRRIQNQSHTEEQQRQDIKIRFLEEKAEFAKQAKEIEKNQEQYKEFNNLFDKFAPQKPEKNAD